MVTTGSFWNRYSNVLALEEINKISREVLIKTKDIVQELGFELNLAPFTTADAWRQYSWDQFQLVEKIAADVGLADHLHLWPDKDMPRSEGTPPPSDGLFRASLVRRYVKRFPAMPCNAMAARWLSSYPSFAR